MILAPISIGELIDKMTILEIKLSEYTDLAKTAHVHKELTELNKLRETVTADIRAETAELYVVNKQIWDNEDRARTYTEDNYQADPAFATLAWQTYKNNTRRAEIKRAINQKCNSAIVETKSYMRGD
jgi:plasmid maintenance system antidote protein VapI